MSYCKKCGNELSDHAKFCGKCGTKVVSMAEDFDIHDEHEEKMEKSKKNKTLLIIGLVFILLALFIAVIFVVKKQKDVKEYERYILKAERYVEKLEYEQAEDAYLRAIAIDEKQLEPYVRLAEVYIILEEYDKAEDILEQAEDAKAEGNEEIEEEKKEVEETLDEIKDMIEYSWVVEPTIEADDIYYIKSCEDYISHNELRRQDATPIAVIDRGGQKGLIDMNGKMLVETEYTEIVKFMDYYWLQCEEPVELGGYEQEVIIYDPAEGLLPGIGMGINDRVAFYYYNSLESAVNDVLGYVMSDIPQNPYPVQKTSGRYADFDGLSIEWVRSNGGKYAIFNGKTQVTDFIYDECGTYSEGLLAVCMDGKWGYVDGDGNEIIPLAYDSSWNMFTDSLFMARDNYYDFCYAASDGYVTLCKDGEWELRDTTGKLAIPTGVFEKILPVYEGKCWVKKDGKWGVIKLGKAELNEEKENIQEETLDEPADEPEDKPADESTDKPVDKPANKPTNGTTNNPVEEPNNEPVRDPLSVSEVCRRVTVYYQNRYSVEEYIAYEDECVVTDGGYFCILRYYGGNEANELVTGVSIDIETGEVTDDFDNYWNIYDVR